jgi:signal transduction histidine kinase
MRRQFVLMTLAITSMVVIAFIVPLAFLVRTIASDRAVNHANSDAQYIGQIIAGASRAEAVGLVAQADASAAGTISVYYADGTVIGDRARPPEADSLQLARRGRAFNRSAGGGVDVFLPVLGAKGQTTVVRVSIGRSEIERGVWAAWIALALLGLVLIAVAGLVADRMARSVTRPMRTLTDIARRLGGGDLEARSRVKGSAEIVEVSRALDTLAGRIGDLMQAEREHAADLSHRLRTPLTALRLDAELLHDEADARRIAAAVDDLEAVVTSVIAETRGEPRPPEPRGVDLCEAVRERMAFWGVLARGQERAIEIRLHDTPLPVNARRHDVQELLDVLVGNVLRHTPPGRAARVTTAARPQGGGHLVVEDAGPGFETNAREPARGTGLGLDIARRVAFEAGGSLALSRSDLGGARVDVALGPPIRDERSAPGRDPR